MSKAQGGMGVAPEAYRKEVVTQPELSHVCELAIPLGQAANIHNMEINA